MADTTSKRVVVELDAAALPNLKKAFGDVEKGAEGMGRAVGKARGSMISDLRMADRGVQSLSHSVFMLGSAAGGMDAKFAQAFQAFTAIHAALMGVRGLAMEIRILSGAMDKSAGSTLRAAAANKTLAASEKEVATAAIAKRAAIGIPAKVAPEKALAGWLTGQMQEESPIEAHHILRFQPKPTPWHQYAGAGTMAGAFKGAGAAMPVAAAAVVAAAALVVLNSHEIQNWLGNQLASLTEKRGALGGKNESTLEKAYRKWQVEPFDIMTEPDPRQKLRKIKDWLGIGGGGKDEHTLRLESETRLETAERMRMQRFQSEQSAIGTIAARAPFLERQRQLEEMRADLGVRATFGPSVPGAGRRLAGPFQAQLQGIYGIQSRFPKLMEHGGDIALQTRMEEAQEIARQMGRRKAESQAEIGLAGFGALRALGRYAGAQGELAAWQARTRSQLPTGFVGEKGTAAEGQRLQERLKQTADEYKVALDKVNEAKARGNQLDLEDLQKTKEIANQEMLRYRSIRQTAEAKLLSMKQELGLMDPSKIAATRTLMDKLERGPKPGRAPRWQQIGGRWQLDPGTVGGLTQEELAFAQGNPALREKLKKWAEANAERDPQIAAIMKRTEEEKERAAGLAGEKAAMAVKVDLQTKIEAKLDANAEALAGDIAKSLVPLVQQMILQLKVAMQQELNRQQNLKQAADKAVAPGN